MGQKILVLALHQFSGAAAHVVFRVGTQVSRVSQPSYIIKLMSGRTGNRSTACSPISRSKKLRNHPILFTISGIFIFFQVLTDHPPPIVIYFVDSAVRAKKQRSVLR